MAALDAAPRRLETMLVEDALPWLKEFKDPGEARSSWATWDGASPAERAAAAKPIPRIFAEDDQRGPALTVEGGGLFLDYSKNRMTKKTLSLLMELARACDLEGRREKMFTGQKINIRR